MVDAFTQFARLFPTLASCIIVWLNLDEKVFNIYQKRHKEVTNERLLCNSYLNRQICIPRLSDVADMLALAVGFCTTFIVAGWLSPDKWDLAFLTLLSFTAPGLFLAYIWGPPIKYISWVQKNISQRLGNHLPDVLAVIYLILVYSITSYFL